MKSTSILKKIKGKLWSKVIKISRNHRIYPMLYKSFWHKSYKRSRKGVTHYFAATPNAGAGIGHQLANWIAGYWFSKVFNLKFAHVPFSVASWELFFSFGNGEDNLNDLVARGHKIVRLPLFDEANAKEMNIIQNIINSYDTEPVVFLAEQDQYYADQYGIIEDLQNKFYSAEIRKTESISFDPDHFNIAVHVRRGDITLGQKNKNPNLLMRWQNDDYFSTVLMRVLNNIITDKQIHIYLFSQGSESDFLDFKKFKNVHFCLTMTPRESFLHMVFADVLITSKSSFSYKPALLSKGVKICPRDFWHGYPDRNDFILAEEIGTFDVDRFNSNF